ncbi:hypothetical protein CR513_33573, partial [Mucuna pruriens]
MSVLCVRSVITVAPDGHDSEDPKQSTADMTAFVQNLLQQMLHLNLLLHLCKYAQFMTLDFVQFMYGCD